MSCTLLAKIYGMYLSSTAGVAKPATVCTFLSFHGSQIRLNLCCLLHCIIETCHKHTKYYTTTPTCTRDKFSKLISSLRNATRGQPYLQHHSRLSTYLTPTAMDVYTFYTFHKYHDVYQNVTVLTE